MSELLARFKSKQRRRTCKYSNIKTMTLAVEPSAVAEAAAEAAAASNETIEDDDATQTETSDNGVQHPKTDDQHPKKDDEDDSDKMPTHWVCQDSLGQLGGVPS